MKNQSSFFCCGIQKAVGLLSVVMILIAWAMAANAYGKTSKALIVNPGEFTQRGSRTVETAACLEAIARQTGIRIYVMGPLPEWSRIGDDAPQPVEDVIKSVLKGVSYALVYGDTAEEGTLLRYSMPGAPHVAAGQRRASRAPMLAETASDTGAASSFQEHEETETTAEQTDHAEPNMEMASASSQAYGAGEANRSTGAAMDDAGYSASGSEALMEESVDGTTGASSERRIEDEVFERLEEEDHLRAMIRGLEDHIASGQADLEYETWCKYKDPRMVKHAEETLNEFEEKLDNLLRS